MIAASRLFKTGKNALLGHWLSAIGFWLLTIGVVLVPFFQDITVVTHLDNDSLGKIAVPTGLARSLYPMPDPKQNAGVLEYVYHPAGPNPVDSLHRDFKKIRALAPKDKAYQRAVDHLHSYIVIEFYPCFAWFALALFFEVFTAIRSRKRARESNRKFVKVWLGRYWDYRSSGVLILLSICFIFFLAKTAMISTGIPMEDSDDGSFWHARGEFFVSLGFVVAIIGTAFALWAKKRADEVFEISSDIHRQLTAFFSNYDSVIDPEFPGSVPDLIKRARKSLTFFMGPPLMGYFRNPNNGLEFQNMITNKINHKPGRGFTVNYICWSDERCQEYVAKLKTDDQRNQFQAARLLLFASIRNNGGRVDHYALFQDPMIRFVIADDEEAIFWVIDDYSPQGILNDQRKKENFGTYPGGGFTTDSAGMVRLLKNIYENVDKMETSSAAPIAAE